MLIKYMSQDGYTRRKYLLKAHINGRQGCGKNYLCEISTIDGIPYLFSTIPKESVVLL